MTPKHAASHQPIRVLVAEDSRTQAEHLRHVLEEHGYAVTAAGNGQAALAAARSARPDLIISDVVMPGMDGYDLCRAIKSSELLKDIPVILVTALSGPHDVMTGLACGADSFICKPYDERYLLSRLRYLHANEELRLSEKTQVGLQVEIAGQRHFITAARQQILGLLISTYEEAVRLNEEVRARQKEIERSHAALKELYHIAKDLNRATSEEGIVRAVLDRVMALPWIQSGWIVLREEASCRVALTSHLPAALARPGALEGECLCRHKLLAGEIERSVSLVECERLARAEVPGGPRRHALIPLWVGDQVLGVMNLIGPDDGAFSTEDLELLNGIGNQIGIALERADLHAELERKVAERTAALEAQIAERRNLEQQLHQAQKMEAIGRLAGGIAHDFNNLLTAVLGYAELLIEGLDAGSPLAEGLHEIRKAGERAAALTRQLLAFGRRQVLQPRVVDLNAVVRSTENLLRRLIGEDIELVARLAPDLGTIKADPTQLEQILLNLAVNARDAMPGGGRLTIETGNVDLDEAYVARHLTMSAGRYVMVSVSDTGCGMDADVQAHIFEPFFTTKERGKGTGLGLSTVYGIVKQSAGSIWVYSEPGLGTAFKIYLPRVGERPDAIRPPAAVSRRTHGTETVLVVEDDEGVRDLCARVLTRLGYTVLDVAAPDAALALLDARPAPIHLLLTDLVMPGMSGRALADRLRAARPTLKVLFMSGYTDSGAGDREVLPAHAAFIPKPFSPMRLAERVREVLDAPARPDPGQG